MAFSKKTWKDRVSQYINRRLLTDSDGNTQQVTVTRDEGSVTEAGDAFSASNMNDLEDRIEDAFDGLTAADIPYSAGVSVADKIDEIPSLASDTVSVSSGVTANKVQLLKYGKVVFLTMAIKVSSPSSWQVIGTIPSAYFPKWSIFGVMINTTSANNLQTAHVNVEPDGRIRLANTLPDSRDTYTFDLTWIIE